MIAHIADRGAVHSRARSAHPLAPVRLALLSLLLAGCVARPPFAPPPVPWEQRLSALQGISDFELEGRVGASDGQQGFSAGLHWRQRQDSATLDLTAPLGVGAAHIEQTGDDLT